MIEEVILVSAISGSIYPVSSPIFEENFPVSPREILKESTPSRGLKRTRAVSDINEAKRAKPLPTETIAKDLLNSALEIRYSNSELAIKWCNKALSISNSFYLKSEINNCLGLIYFSQSYLNHAVYYFREAIYCRTNFGPPNAILYHNLALALKMRKEGNDLASAVKHCDEGLTITLDQESKAEFIFMKIQILNQMGNHESAHQIADRYNQETLAHENSIDSDLIAKILFEQALALEGMGNIPEAILLLKDILKVPLNDKSLNADILNSLGVAYENQKKYRHSIKCYTKALRLKADDKNLKAQLLYNLGISLNFLNEPNLAKDCYEQASKIQITDESLRAKISNCLAFLTPT